ncbi:hypothetical protein O181_019724 [Austropuccinia psidii MF-1]|uniref:Uncharacterized protein n=1 Tax=Austropuccinia psidii MF-1 TaxID=1389203 RepID=A0A9Q3GV10_9BASI|nr:hypothetical protein [Austropuccinia psidii MF-1]
MNFPNHNAYDQPIGGSSSGPDQLEQMNHEVSKHDEVIDALMQQAEDKDEAKHNPWESNDPQTKGQSTHFQNWLPQGPLPRSNTPKTTFKPKRSYTPNPKSTISVNFSPVQMLMKDSPRDFKYTKEALYVHIKLLWDILTPSAPDEQLLKESYQRFSTAEEVQTVAQNSQGAKLISKAQVQTLQDAQAGKRKIGPNIINMQDFYITYIHAMLAKLGIRIWAPDLQEAPNSLYNEACCIVALMTF